jgi:plastocyanin
MDTIVFEPDTSELKVYDKVKFEDKDKRYIATIYKIDSDNIGLKSDDGSKTDYKKTEDNLKLI